jgi:hypothetical protein
MMAKVGDLKQAHGIFVSWLILWCGTWENIFMDSKNFLTKTENNSLSGVPSYTKERCFWQVFSFRSCTLLLYVACM